MLENKNFIAISKLIEQNVRKTTLHKVMKRYCKNKLTEKSFSSKTEPEHHAPSEN
jgi:hypothetical protein